MFTVLWTVAFIVNGVPHIEAYPDVNPALNLEGCQSYILTYEYRMPDWFRGRIGAPLDAPLGVKGECKAVDTPL